MALWALLLLSLINTVGCQPFLVLRDVPRHAAASGGGCEPGFFRGGTTCRACRVGACPVGWAVVPCAAAADTSCAQCPPPAAGYAYVAGGCDATRCVDGWTTTLITGSSAGAVVCAPCPVGAYCAGGVLRRCPGNCTTTGPGAAGLLECGAAAGGNNNEEDGFALQSTFTAPALGAPPDRCPDLDTLMIAWLAAPPLNKQATFQGCGAAVQTDQLGTLTCTFAAASCVASEFRSWMLSPPAGLLARSRDALAACLGAPTLVLGAPLLQRVPVVTPLSQRPRAARPTDAPVLVVPRRHWGQSHFETLGTLGLVSAVLCGLSVGAAAMCALACVRAHRRRTSRGLYAALARVHDRVMARMRRWRSSSSSSVPAAAPQAPTHIVTIPRAVLLQQQDAKPPQRASSLLNQHQHNKPPAPKKRA